MYHCRLRFAFIGQECEAFDVIRSAKPLDQFSHEFISPVEDGEKTDVYVLNLSDTPEKEAMFRAKSYAASDAEMILIIDREQVDFVIESIPGGAELWVVPADKKELEYRFLRWQKAVKTEKDRWLYNQYNEAVINSSPSMIWYKDKNGIHRKVNDSFCGIVGKSKDNIVGKDHCGVWDVGPEDALVCNVSDANVMLTGATCVSEERVITKTDTKLFTTYKSPLYDVDGTVMGTVGIGVDITQERAYEEEIVEKNHSLETIFTSLDCGILCHSYDGSHVMSVNNTALEILGYESKEDMEASGFSFVADSVLDVDKPLLRNRIQSLVNVGDITDVEYRVRHDNGDIRHVMGSIKLMEENGELYYQRFLLDYTAKKLEEARILKDALAQANRASQAKSTFLFNISHDIRTPMNAIVGFTSLAIKHIDDEKRVREYLEKIMSSSRHLLELINDVLDMSRIESGKAHLEQAPCRLTEILTEVKDVFAADAAAKELRMSVDTSGIRDDDILCDKLRLRQVFMNLVSNSVKYTNPGGHISLTASQEKSVSETERVYSFVVKDDGTGMTEEFLSRIFEPFEREKSSTISGIQGTGLGMTITKNIVDMMNGAISIESAPGKGTTVKLSFTFQSAGEFDASILSGPGAGSGHENANFEGRILLVEDNDINCEIATAILTDAGFEVEAAENGQIAVDMVKSSEAGYYKLILMDIQMPVMNGYDATRAIRALPDPAHSRIPIFAMTANAFDEDKRDAFSAGMNGHISKPIDADKLLDTLERLV